MLRHIPGEPQTAPPCCSVASYFELLPVRWARSTKPVPWTADFTRDIALNYVKRGYHLLCRHAVTLLLMPVAATVLVRSQAEHAVVALLTLHS